MTLAHCPLCSSADVREFALLGERRYHICAVCDLVALSPAHHLTFGEERARYDHHCNGVENVGYRAHLTRAIDPILRRLAPQSTGLDFGCGPVPAASTLLEELGYSTFAYDPIYFPKKPEPQQRFDFILCIEVAEHFREPADDFAVLDSLLRAGGILSLMTILRNEDVSFESWWYVRDPTHVVFYSLRSLLWISNRFGWTLEGSDGQVHLFQKIM